LNVDGDDFDDIETQERFFQEFIDDLFKRFDSLLKSLADGNHDSGFAASIIPWRYKNDRQPGRGYRRLPNGYRSTFDNEEIFYDDDMVIIVLELGRYSADSMSVGMICRDGHRVLQVASHDGEFVRLYALSNDIHDEFDHSIINGILEIRLYREKTEEESHACEK